MICTNCGNNIDESAVFCPLCGTKLEQPSETEDKKTETADSFDTRPQRSAPEQLPPSVSADELRKAIADNTAATPDIPPRNVETEPMQVRPMIRERTPEDRLVPPPSQRPHPSSHPSQPPQQYRMVRPESQRQHIKPAKQKEFFGMGAFIVTLVIIALLSCSTGVFAALYFSAVGMI